MRAAGMTVAELIEGDGKLVASRWETAGIAAGSALAGLYGAALVWAGLGKIDRLGLGLFLAAA